MWTSTPLVRPSRREGTRGTLPPVPTCALHNGGRTSGEKREHREDNNRYSDKYECSVSKRGEDQSECDHGAEIVDETRGENGLAEISGVKTELKHYWRKQPLRTSC
jgi:hypothetical protein